MRIRCPNCHHGLEIVPDTPAEFITCPSCGSQLDPNSGETVTYKPETRQVIGRFELLEHVGRGHFGNVWRARDTMLKRVVAVKIPRTADLTEADRVLIIREAITAGHLRHANIVTVHEVGQDGDSIFIVSEFIEGVPLSEQLKIRQPTFAEAARWCQTIAEALDYAHEKGVVHRDIKPGNIMLEGDDKLFVLDFGLAKTEGGEFTITTEGEILGTPAYMSPEQARGDAASADRRSDVYSLGVVLYEMLTGQKPFQGGTRSLVHQILNEEPKSPRRLKQEVPRDLETICLRAMAKEPSRRYATAKEMADDLRRYLAGEPIHARPVRWPERSWRWVRRNPALSAASGIAAVAIAVAMTLLGTYFLVRGPEQLVHLQVLQRATPGPTDRTLPEAKQCKVVFWPLDSQTGEIKTVDSVRASGGGRISARLLPGDYLVVVEIPDHGFHEVFRHVPAPGEPQKGGYPIESFTLEADDSVTLPEVKVPPLSCADGMVKLDGATFMMGPDGTPDSLPHEEAVATFFMDAHEVTIGEYRKIRKVLPKAIRDNPEPDGKAVHDVNWLQAMTYAESMGKRLPEEKEYEAAATNYGRQKYPWKMKSPPRDPWLLEEAGGPNDDRAEVAPEITGLFSNVGEWTRSWATLPAGSPISHPLADVQRVVRGALPAVIDGVSGPIDPSIEPRTRMFYIFFDEKPGLGFRCVRSAKPRLAKKDFLP